MLKRGPELLGSRVLGAQTNVRQENINNHTLSVLSDITGRFVGHIWPSDTFGTSPGTATDSFEKPLLLTDAHVGVSPSLCNLTADRRLLFSGGSRVYRPLPGRSPTTVITALLLILGGVEVNPGPRNITGTTALHQCVSADVESAVCSTSSLTCYKYSAEFLLSLRYDIPAPRRSVRKTIFRYHLWLPRQVRYRSQP